VEEEEKEEKKEEEVHGERMLLLPCN